VREEGRGLGSRSGPLLARPARHLRAPPAAGTCFCNTTTTAKHPHSTANFAKQTATAPLDSISGLSRPLETLYRRPCALFRLHSAPLSRPNALSLPRQSKAPSHTKHASRLLTGIPRAFASSGCYHSLYTESFPLRFGVPLNTSCISLCDRSPRTPFLDNQSSWHPHQPRPVCWPAS
jgi:hypothetical protein